MSATDQRFDLQFHRRQWVATADALADSFATASPFPHVVIDNALPPSALDAVLDEFPEPEAVDWERFDRPTELKLALADVEQMGPVTRELLAEFNGQVFIEFLERITGITGIVGDSHYDGGGLHQIRRGGFLKIHADFNRHEQLDLDRRLNVLLYLNKNWEPAFGGALELWDADMSAAVQRVEPVFNRMVIFATTDHALHGHPEPLTCPPDRARRSMALYYYTNGRPASELTDVHSTLFRSRPGEQWRTPWKRRLKRWVPPAIVDASGGVKRRVRSLSTRGL